MKRLLFAITLLLWSTTAQAIPYTVSVALDLTTLRFSRPVEVLPRSQQQTVNVLDMNSRCMTIHGCTDISVPGAQDGVFFTSWQEGRTSQALPNVGEAVSFVEPSQMGGALTLLGSGFMQTDAERNAFVVVTESGPLTISIDYAITHRGAPADSDTFGLGDFRGIGHTQLLLTDPTGFSEMALREFLAPRGDAFQSGTLSVTQSLMAGQLNFLNLRVSADVTQPRGLSVPEPSSLWLMGLGFVGLFFVRRLQSRRHPA